MRKLSSSQAKQAIFLILLSMASLPLFSQGENSEAARIGPVQLVMILALMLILMVVAFIALSDIFKRLPQGKAAGWLIIVILFPVVGILVYYIAGPGRSRKK